MPQANAISPAPRAFGLSPRFTISRWTRTPSGPSNPPDPTPIGQVLCFNADDGIHGTPPWSLPTCDRHDGGEPDGFALPSVAGASTSGGRGSARFVVPIPAGSRRPGRASASRRWISCSSASTTRSIGPRL